MAFRFSNFIDVARTAMDCLFTKCVIAEYVTTGRKTLQ